MAAPRAPGTREAMTGSHATPAKDMPRTCHLCGQRILTSKQPFQHHVNDITGHQYAWHINCKPRRRHTMSIEETEPTPIEPTPTDPDPEPDTDDDDSEDE
jgi:hypothetical protein